MDRPDEKDIVFDAPTLLLGGGPVAQGDLAAMRARSGALVAADGGANRLLDGPLRPDAVIGDMDSVARPEIWERAGDVRFLRLADQDSTDLEKCLRLVRAPLLLGLGFLGGRMDHSLAALHALLAHEARRVLLLGAGDVAFAAPRRWRARLAPGAVVSVFPLRACVALRSRGLRWPLEALALEAGGTIGTSNMAETAQVAIDFDRAGAVILLERRWLDAAIDSLPGAPG